MDSGVKQSPGKSLAHFCAEVFPRIALSQKLIALTNLHILDSIAAILSGSALEASLQGQQYARSRSQSAEASVYGTNIRTDVINAALGNGLSAHADESDDSHEDSQTHPGCGVLPAVLAIAEWKGSSGEDTVKAVLLGYEVTIRFGRALVPCMSFARSSLSCHAFAPLFGAGFGCGYLLGFTAAQYLILLNYLAQEASGLTTWRLDKAHTLKSYVFAGMPASNAVKCALMVHAGWTGAGDVLGDDRNFFAAIAPQHNLSLDLDGLGQQWGMTETDFKRYSVGFPIAAPLAALEQILVENNDLQLKDIASVEVFYDPDWYAVIGDANAMPDLNLRHCLAATLIRGHLSFADSHDESLMQVTDIVEAGKLVQLLKPLSKAQDRFEAVVRVTDRGGKTYSAKQGKDVLGRIDNPMTPSQVEDKARELLQTVLGYPQVENVIEIVRGLHQAKDLGTLIKACTPT